MNENIVHSPHVSCHFKWFFQNIKITFIAGFGGKWIRNIVANSKNFKSQAEVMMKWNARTNQKLPWNVDEYFSTHDTIRYLKFDETKRNIQKTMNSLEGQKYTEKYFKTFHLDKSHKSVSFRLASRLSKKMRIQNVYYFSENFYLKFLTQWWFVCLFPPHSFHNEFLDHHAKLRSSSMISFSILVRSCIDTLVYTTSGK